MTTKRAARGPRTSQRLSSCALALVLAAGAGACERDPQTVHAQAIQKAERYSSQGKLPEAIIEYRNAVQALPQSADARLKLAETYLTAGDVPNALREYIRAADLLPDRADVQLTAGSLLLLSRRFDDAKVRAEKALETAPRSVDAHVLLANALAGLRNLDAAIAEIEEALSLQPGRGATYSTLGVIETGRGRLDAAERAFRKAVELEDSSAPAHLALANFYWAAGRLPEAEDALRRALAIAPDDLVAHRAMASLAVATGRPAEAESHLKKLVELSDVPGPVLALADFYIVRNDHAAARRVLQQLVNGPAPPPQAELRLAALDEKAGHRDQAYARIDRVLATQPAALQALLLKTRLLLADSRREDALASAEQAVQAHSKSAAAFHSLGRVQAARNQIDAAIAAHQEALRLNPRAAASQVALAQLHLASGRSQASVSFAQDAVKNEPRNPDARLALIRSLMAQGELQRASVELDRLGERFPSSSTVLVQKGILSSLRKDLAAARQHFEAAAKLDPGSSDALAGLVAMDLAARQPDAARARVDAQAARPDAPVAMLMVAGQTYFAIGDRGLAERLFRRVLDRDPASLQAYLSLAQLYVVQGRLDEALTEFEAIAARDPRPVGALTLAGIILLAQGKMDDARTRFERALEVDSTAAVAANNLAWIYAESGGNLDVALQLAQTASRKLPDMAQVSDTLGFIYYKKDLLPQAVETLRAAVAKDPRSPVYHYHLGLALAKGGDAPGAVTHLQRALGLKPDFDGAEEARSVLRTLETR